eukprot:9257772-Alexandrium_andersonii.AAC.1
MRRDTGSQRASEMRFQTWGPDVEQRGEPPLHQGNVLPQQNKDPCHLMGPSLGFVEEARVHERAPHAAEHLW